MLRLRRTRKVAEYPAGTCTRFVYDVVPWVPRGWGDAWQWPTSASEAGYAVTTYPLPGAIAVWDPGTSHGVHGHVGLVTTVMKDQTYSVLDPSGSHLLHNTWGMGSNPQPTHFIQAPPTPHSRPAPGIRGAGRGAGPDAIADVVSAWDALAYYWNHTAPLQAIRGGVIEGMIAGLF